MKKIIIALFIIHLFIFPLFLSVAKAEEIIDDDSSGQQEDLGAYKLQIPIFDYAESQNIAEYIAKIYQYVMIILIPLLIIVIIIAGISWIAAAGDSGKIGKAKDRIKSGFAGLGLAFFSYIILSLVGIDAINVPGLMKISRIEGDILEGEFANDTAVGGGGAMMSAVPRLYQCDDRSLVWDEPGGNRTVCSGGCGLVSTVMAIKYYGKNITVAEAAKWTVANGWRKIGQRGLSYEGINALAKRYGLNFKQLPLDFNTLKGYASSKNPIVILLRGPCKFTQNGHFVVLAGWDSASNQFVVNDPGSHSDARTHGTWAEIAQSCTLEAAGVILP